MTKDKIKKVAQNYHENLVSSFVFRLKEDAQEDGDVLIDAYATEIMDIQKAFIDGAEWRINSVWHNMSEEPKCKCMLALYNNGCVITINWDGCMKWEKMNKLYRIEKWAYVKDLLPDEEK